LDRDELAALLKGCDRGQKGYVAAAKFIDKLYSLASETETETILRRLAKALQHSSTNLKQELERADTSGKGKLDQLTFKRTMKSLSIALSDQEIQKLQASSMVASKQISMKKEEMLDIKAFAAQVSEAARAKPLPSFILAGNKGKNAGAGSGGNSAEAEKKFKRNLEVLKSEIEDKNRELESLRTEVKDALDRCRRLERDKEALQTRLVDGQSKPPKETQVEAMNYSQAQELAKVKDQLWAQQ
jgi:Ca2+-binding EF-hand superfamily protein